MSKKIFLFCLLTIGLFSCGTSNEEAAVEVAVPPPATNLAPEGPAAELLYAWVDALNLREAPKTSAKVVTKVNTGDALTYRGEKTSFNEKIELRGVAYDEPWMKVTAPDGKTGWVFGGAVKRGGEIKGTEKPRKGLVNIPHFGRYDLNTWTKESEDASEAGDAEMVVSVYSSGSWLMRVNKNQTGEYGYSRSYKLYGADGELLKARELVWSNDPTFNLTEDVYDFEADPAKKYTRNEVFEKHYMQLKQLPETVAGDFTESTLSPAEMEEARDIFRRN